jgi:hypothetical protein
MTKKNTTKPKLTLPEIALIAILSIFFIIIPLIVFLKNIDLDYIEKPVDIGNNIAGLLAPFLSLAGSILVYIAFKAQIQANKEIQNQFTKQNNDQHFYRLIDSLDKRISQYSFTEDNEQYSGYNILTLFIKKIRRNLERQTSDVGRKIFITHPEVIPDSDYKRIYPHFDDEIFINPQKVKEAFLNTQPQDREDIFSNGLLQYQMHDGESFENGLREIALSNFYKVPAKNHLNFYYGGFRDLMNSNASFFDGYFKTLELILNHIHQNNNDVFYINYLKGNLTTIEKSIIFLYLGCFKNKPQMNGLIIKYGILDDLSYVRGVKIGNPTAAEFLEHIKNHLKT